MNHSIGIIGGGAWGTALAQCMAEAGRPTLLWAREGDVVSAINDKHENTVFLPHVKLNKKLKATGDIDEAAACDVILMVTPAQHLRKSLHAVKSHLTGGKPLVICAKGIELETGHLLSDVVRQETPGATVAVLTGPTFASEIARGLPSAVTLAAQDKDTAQQLRDKIACRTLRPYITDDMTGAQIGGAVKNVIAIAAGIIAGKGLGDSARAALITRGLAEMARLAAALGAQKETLLGLCGVGDLMLTCSSLQSRNYSLGYRLGEGMTLDDILGKRNAVTEGVYTVRALMVMAEKNAIDMPVCEAVYKCLCENMPINDAIAALLDRPLKERTETQ